jgi:hypothetical protein
MDAAGSFEILVDAYLETVVMSLKQQARDWTAGIQFVGGVRFFSPPQHPDRQWVPPSLLSSG